MSEEKPEEAKKNPLLLILVLINTGFILFILLQQFQLGDEVDKLTQKSTPNTQDQNLLPHIPRPGENNVISTYELGDFSVNLARPSGPQRFIKLSITLIVETPRNNKLLEIINKTPTIRDEIIALLNKKTPKDILKLEGREVIKNRLKNHINSKLKDDQIKRILFTRFTVS